MTIAASSFDAASMPSVEVAPSLTADEVLALVGSRRSELTTGEVVVEPLATLKVA